MFRAHLSGLPELNARIRALRPAAKRNFDREMRNAVRPAILLEVRDLVATYPGTVRYPFAFSTDKSRRAYFATKGFGRGIPYKRTGTLARAWEVHYSFAEGKGQIIVVNTANAAKYVYGTPRQRQVPGHAHTGWGRDLPVAFQLIDEYATKLIIDAWGRAVGLAIQERG
jgi:hypothetical protein